jgi:hypothetical protein
MDGEGRVGDYLRTLSICHYVYAGLAFCFSGFGLIYVVMGQFFGRLIELAPRKEGEPAPPPELGSMFTWLFTGVGVAIMVAALAVSLLCFLSARAMTRRRNRTLSLVVAGLLCLTGLLGIALGVFTFIVLLKPEAERLYAATEPPQ